MALQLDLSVGSLLEPAAVVVLQESGLEPQGLVQRLRSEAVRPGQVEVFLDTSLRYRQLVDLVVDLVVSQRVVGLLEPRPCFDLDWEQLLLPLLALLSYRLPPSLALSSVVLPSLVRPSPVRPSLVQPSAARPSTVLPLVPLPEALSSEALPLLPPAEALSSGAQPSQVRAVVPLSAHPFPLELPLLQPAAPLSVALLPSWPQGSARRSQLQPEVLAPVWDLHPHPHPRATSWCGSGRAPHRTRRLVQEVESPIAYIGRVRNLETWGLPSLGSNAPVHFRRDPREGGKSSLWDRLCPGRLGPWQDRRLLEWVDGKEELWSIRPLNRLLSHSRSWRGKCH